MALNPAANEEIVDGDYEAILSTIMETARGRRFLDEYARRARYRNDLFDFKELRPSKIELANSENLKQRRR